ncbi:hypothetical protein NKH70_19275, partial [Mesorhizobium sp. M0991]|uniref:hypothetical protein n=1 Tax=Mesorhizobium sp. M0991 TaxID=2957043 RepID=UPI00333D16AB
GHRTAGATACGQDDQARRPSPARASARLNYWGISPATERPERRRVVKTTKRDGQVRPERPRD